MAQEALGRTNGSDAQPTEKAVSAAYPLGDLVCLATAIAALGYLTFWACRFTWQSWQFQEVAQGLWAAPIWFRPSGGGLQRMMPPAGIEPAHAV